MTTFICIKDQFNDTHSSSIEGEANREAILNEALDLAERLGIDEDRFLTVGIVGARDEGDARIRPWAPIGENGAVDGSITDLGTMDCLERVWSEFHG